MHNWNILAPHIIHHHLPDLGFHAAVPQEEEVAALEGGLHGAGEDDDNGRGGVGEDGEAFPEHEGGGEDEGEVEDLGGELPGLHLGEGAEHCGRLVTGGDEAVPLVSIGL